MKKTYQTPLLCTGTIHFESVFLYSGLKNMGDTMVCPEDDLDTDN